MPVRSLLFVMVQLFLFLVFAGIPGGYAARFGWQLAAFLMVTGGLIVLFLAIYKLGTGLTPFPVPRKKGKLITDGIYKWVRHPVYLGLLMITSGISLYSLNLARALITFILLLLFYFKSKYEEQLLTEKFPGYQDYKKYAGRFLPKFRLN